MSTAVNKKKIAAWLVSLLVPVAIFLVPTSEQFTPEIRLFLAITVGAVLLWATEPIHTIVPALILPPMYILTGLGTPDLVFASWSQAIPWLLVGGFIISGVFEETGLMHRVAYYCITLAGGTYRGIVFGLLFSGALIALVIPSNGGRVVLYCTLALGIIHALGLEPHSRAASGIMFASFFGAISMGFLYMTGFDNVIIAESMLAKYDYDFSWLEYLKMNFPIFIIWAFVQGTLILFLMKPESPIDKKAFFKEELKKLGPMSGKEKKMSILFIFIIALLIEGTLAPQWIFLFAACLTFLPGMNLADAQTLRKINFPMLVFVTSTMSIGSVASKVGAGQWVADSVFPLLEGSNHVTIIAIVWLLAVAVNFLLTPLAAVGSLTVPIIEVSIHLGMNPIPVVLTFIQGLNQVIFPYEYALVLLMYSFGVVKMTHLMKIFGVRMLLNLVLILAVALPYWKLLGYM